MIPLASVAGGLDPNLSTPVVGAIGCKDCPALAQVKKKNSDLNPFARQMMKNLATEKKDNTEQKSDIESDQSR